MDNGNGDLLKAVSQQYNECHRRSADALLDALSLPNQTKKELKILPLPVPSEDGSVTPIVSKQVTDRVSEYVQIQKDNIWRRPAPQYQQPKKPKPQKQRQKSFTQSWNPSPDYKYQPQQNRGRGGGGGNRGRGRGGRGGSRGGFSSSQASTQSK